VMLGLNAPMQDLIADFALGAASPVCKGFAVGRTLFHDAATAWFAGQIDDGQAATQISNNYQNLLKAWRNLRHAEPVKRAI
ncbi:MAG: DUF2090 domain-containing protein, partial [Rhodospirillaceae bacterium]|nr:DUF2090 domain-containing protein [Rhodospirillaceae bacterium]